MRLLELFSGTGSVGRVAREMGWEVVSLDVCPKYSPDYVADIMDFDFTIWSKGYFDFIWASPPCQLYSIAPAQLFTADQRAQRAEDGNAVSRRTMEVIETLRPVWYAIENPWSSLLWKQGIFEHLTKRKVSYCMYGFPYRKNTCVATNLQFDAKVCKGKCGFIVEHAGHKYHLEVAKQGVSQHTPPGIQKTTHTRDQLYRIPEQLIRDILPPLFRNE